MSSPVPVEQSPAPHSSLRIEIHAGPLAGKGFPFISNRVTIGRTPDNDIALEDAQVSRYHAVLRREGNEVILQDLGSTNGTLVNGERIYGEHVLQPTETITIGPSVLSVAGFPAPSTVSMSAQISDIEDGPWRTYQSGFYQTEQASQSTGNWLLWGGLLALIMLIFAVAGVAVILFNTIRRPPPPSIPTVIISAPVTGSQFELGQSTTVKASATDVSGVVRLELWVAGQKVDQALSPNINGEVPFTAQLTWTPPAEGSYSLEVRAFNQEGLQSSPTIVSILVEDAAQTDIEPTVTDALPADTLPADSVFSTGTPAAGTPFATTTDILNVRTGPGTNYTRIDVLPENSIVQITGKNSDNTWWMIDYPAGPDGRGWISVDYASGQNIDTVVAIETPTLAPTATPTPSETPSPTASATFAPVTATPTATVTPSPTTTPNIGPSVSFTTDRTSIATAECTTLYWLVRNVEAVYFDTIGVAGDENGQAVAREICPTETTTYQLRVVHFDGREETQEIVINVVPKPAVPSSFRIISATDFGFLMSWVDNSNNEKGFRVYDDNANRIVGVFPENANSGEIVNLKCGTTYHLYLVAFHDVAESPPSGIVVQPTQLCQ